MLRPATPLTLFFFIAFVLLLLSTLSTPIIHSVPLAQVRGFNFGVFGWCGPNECSKISLGYHTANITGLDSNVGLNLPPPRKYSLSYILVVHPVAAFMSLVCTGFAAAAHLHSPAHSPRYLLFLLIFSFPTLLLSLLAFLVDLLLFVPNMAWGGWLVLVATLIITGCSVLTCAMRRTLVSRKARKKRIAENADMNGANYYASRQEPEIPKDDQMFVQHSQPDEYARAESPPPLNSNDKSAHFTTYEASDDRTPLNAREPSIKTNSTAGYRDRQQSLENGRPGMPGYAADGSGTPVSPLEPEGLPPNAQRYGGPPAAGPGPGPGAGPGPGPGPNNGYFAGYNGSRGGRGGPMQHQSGMYGRGRDMNGGRGGYGRGGPMYPPGARGPPPQSAAYRGRGGYPPRGAPMRGAPYGMRGPPPPGWRGPPPGWQGPPGMPMGAGGAAMYGTNGARRGPPPGYGNQYPQNDAYARDAAGYDDIVASYGPQAPVDDYDGPFQPENPASQSATVPNSHGAVYAPEEGIVRDPASLGFSGRQASASPARMQSTRDASPPPPMPSDMASAPVGQAIEMDAMHGSTSSPVYGQNMGSPVEMGSNSPIPNRVEPHSQPTELPAAAHASPVAAQQQRDSYYEDVDARFVQHDQAHYDTTAPAAASAPAAHVPSTLMPGYGQQAAAYGQAPGRLDREPSQSSVYTEQQDIARVRSPAESDKSNFTSISQRGVNPQWQPGPHMYAPGGYSQRAPPPRQAQDTLLNNNPDFEVPGGKGPGGRRYSAGANGPRSHHAAQSSVGGRYPDANGM